MANVRESFATLEDSATGAGLPLHKVLEGDAAAAKNASPALVAKDDSNNLIYLRTNASGALEIIEGGFACLQDAAEVTGSATNVDVCTITGQNSKKYRVMAAGSCTRHATFEVVGVDDVGVSDTETILGYIDVGPGDFFNELTLECNEWTSGASGVQEIRLRAKNNFGVNSDLRGTLTAKEI